MLIKYAFPCNRIVQMSIYGLYQFFVDAYYYISILCTVAVIVFVGHAVSERSAWTVVTEVLAVFESFRSYTF